MSDTFDHEGDAWDSYESNREDGGYYDDSSARRGSLFVRDPLYYHTRVTFKRMINTTDLAVQLELPDGREMWVPRSVCRNWCDGSVYVHSRTLRTSLANAKHPTDLLDLLDDGDELD